MGVDERGELTAIVVLEVSGLLRASEKSVVEAVLARLPGMVAVAAKRKSVGLEVLVAGVVLAITAVLVATTPASHARAGAATVERHEAG